MDQICDIKLCTGCFACLNICPQHAIALQYDQFGNTIPSISNELCIDCGLCKKVCPVNTPLKFSKANHSIAAWSKNLNDQIYSSSGGVATVFSRSMIHKGGVVFGAVSEDKNVKQKKIESIQELEKLRGSKYVQSYTGTTYREVKELLERNIEVLYIGLPCQIAGLKNYIGREYLNLVTVDLICHGTPPMKLLRDYLDESTNGDWDCVSFRGQYNWMLTAYFEDKIVFQKERNLDPYFKAFLEAMIYRENCYSCPYAQSSRVSDITIGDFWGLNRNTLSIPYTGRISLVLLNTSMGYKFWEQCQDQFVWEKRLFDEALNKEQSNLLHSSIPHKDRDKFKKNYLTKGFAKAVMCTSIGWTIYKYKIRKRLLDITIIKKLHHLL